MADDATLPPTRADTDLSALVAAVGADLVVTDPDVLASYAHDDAEWAPYGRPLALVRPETSEQVRAAVAWCAEHRVPVIARGAGTGLSGGANAVDGALMLSFERMTRVLEVSTVERWVRVQPGVVNDHLRAAVAEQGLWYPPDPASSPWSTIGGNIATNAGGMCCVKYGVTGDYVLELEIVTAAGELTRVGRRTAKGVAGYDLCSLIVGSEGTLAIVTEAVLRLRPLPAEPITVAGYFTSVVDAGNAVRAVAAAGLVPSTFELVDKHCLAAVDAWKHMGLSVEAEIVLIARTDVPGDGGLAEATGLVQCFEEAGATFVAQSSDPQESEALYAARRLAYPAVERLGPVLTEDVCVPMAKVPEMLSRIEEIAQRYDVTIANVAHVGDGNLHPLLIVPPNDEEAKAHAQAAFEEVITATLQMGGTVTGEHGVGLLKLPGLLRELSPTTLAMHHAVKAALDPHGILNPGKVIPVPDPS